MEEKGLNKVSIKFVGGGVSNKNNIWWSGCHIAFVSIGTVSRVQLWTFMKTPIFVMFMSFCPTLACTIPLIMLVQCRCFIGTATVFSSEFSTALPTSLLILEMVIS
jgi:hypothetical protein